jgi:Holliday junction resolvase RusA-like endonuclease
MKALISKSTGKAFAKPSGRYSEWRNNLVTQVAKLIEVGVVETFPEGPVGVELIFVLRRPKSHPKRRVATDEGVVYNGADLDKYVRAVFDGFTVAGLWGDDNQVAAVSAMKVYQESQWIGTMGMPDVNEGVTVRVYQHSGGYNPETFV